MIETQQRDSAPQTFGALSVSAPIARSLKTMRYTEPTPIQEQTIPALRQGKDVLGQAQTGTGKTAGFGIPLIENIKTGERGVQAIVLVPTRELCLQVADELNRLGAYADVRVLPVYGGVGLTRQIEGLKRGAQVVVGTPGRVEDLLQRGVLKLGSVRFAVLDEADRMLDVGFLPAIERILKQTPVARQTALFSATIPLEVHGLARRHMRDPLTIEVDPERATVEEIDQRFEYVDESDKLAALRAHLDNPACYLALVFRRTTYKADRLTRDLSRQGYKVAALHGRRSQSQRERVLADLKAGKLQAVIATDIAARGLDIVGLTHVFNYDMPDTSETYVHRIGRTGRAGETGTSITFITPDDQQALRALERHLATGRGETQTNVRSSQRSPRSGAQRGGNSGQPRPSITTPGTSRPRGEHPSSRPSSSRNGSPPSSERRGGPRGRGPSQGR